MASHTVSLGSRVQEKLPGPLEGLEPTRNSRSCFVPVESRCYHVHDVLLLEERVGGSSLEHAQIAQSTGPSISMLGDGTKSTSGSILNGRIGTHGL